MYIFNSMQMSADSGPRHSPKFLQLMQELRDREREEKQMEEKLRQKKAGLSSEADRVDVAPRENAVEGALIAKL
jgi:hypothetical protein